MGTCMYDSGVNVGGLLQWRELVQLEKLLIFLLLLLISYTIFFPFRRLSYTPRYLINYLDEICIAVTGTINFYNTQEPTYELHCKLYTQNRAPPRLVHGQQTMTCFQCSCGVEKHRLLLVDDAHVHTIWVTHAAPRMRRASWMSLSMIVTRLDASNF